MEVFLNFFSIIIICESFTLKSLEIIFQLEGLYPIALNNKLMAKRIKVFLKTKSFNQRDKILYLDNLFENNSFSVSKLFNASILNFVETFNYSDESASQLLFFLKYYDHQSKYLYKIAGNLYLDYILKQKDNKKNIIMNHQRTLIDLLNSLIFTEKNINNINNIKNINKLHKKLEELNYTKEINNLLFIYEIKNKIRPLNNDDISPKKPIFGSDDLNKYLKPIQYSHLSALQKVKRMIALTHYIAKELPSITTRVYIDKISNHLHDISLSRTDNEAYALISRCRETQTPLLIG